MTDKEKKKTFLKNYAILYGNLSEALKKSDLKHSEFNAFMDLPEFRKEVEAVKQLRSDLIDSKFLSLVKQGDVRAIIKAKEIEAERKNGINIDELKVKIMVYLITHAKTKTLLLSEFCDWFNLTDSQAETFFKKIIIEHKLKSKTPIARAKEERKKIESSLAERFKNNKLTEIEMLKGLLEQALYTAETAEYPSERATASKEAREIGKRMEEIQEREEKKKRLSLFDTSVLMDSTIFGVTPEKIKEIEAQQSWIPKIEVKD